MKHYEIHSTDEWKTPTLRDLKSWIQEMAAKGWRLHTFTSVNAIYKEGSEIVHTAVMEIDANV